MRGISEKQSVMLSLISHESRVPKDHPLRQIKAMADQELKRLSAKVDQMYSHTGRPSIPPEAILKLLLLIAVYNEQFPHCPDVVVSLHQVCLKRIITPVMILRNIPFVIPQLLNGIYIFFGN